jgi:ABC-type multidrug transport system fused ATPase/permease subunit
VTSMRPFDRGETEPFARLHIMARLEQTLMRAGARLLGFPPGMGALLNQNTRRRLMLSLVGSVVLSGLDMLGVVALLPMMQYVAGLPDDQGALGLVNRALGGPSNDVLIAALAGLIAGTFVVKDLLAVFFRRWQLHFMAEQEVDISTRLLTGYLVGPYAWHLVRNTADKMWTIEAAVAMGYSAGVSSALGALTEVLTVTVIFGALIFVSPVAALAAALYFGVAGLLVQGALRKRVAAVGERNMATSRVTAKTSLQALGAAKEIKLRRAHERFVDEYAAARVDGAHARATAVLLTEMPKYLLEVVFVVGIGLLAFGITAISGAREGVVVLGVFVAAGTRILPSSVRLIALVGQIRLSRKPLAHLVREVDDQRTAAGEEIALVTTDAVPSGDVEIRDLTFAYSDEPDALVLKGVDAELRHGSSTAVVGSSGAGKSTFVDILLGLHRPRSGMIAAGGIDIFANLPAWQQQLAVVPQEVYLLDESLRRNISFDEPEEDEQMRSVVARAQLDDLVASLPEGLDTEVGERGVRLSGGQRQRIGIARALYRRPSILVLDEATSALDNETERRLTETIASLHGTMTMLIVAHRLSTVRRCDHLLFMSEGKVVARGTFEEVLSANEEFANLVRLGSLDTVDTFDSGRAITSEDSLIGLHPSRTDVS